MIVEGSSEKPYEVYTGGEAATEPTPEFPLPITSAENYDAEKKKYEVGIGVTGKNLFDTSEIPTKTQGGATVTNNGDGSFTVSGSGTLTDRFFSSSLISHNETIELLKKGKIKLEQNGNCNPHALVQLVKSSGREAWFQLNDYTTEAEVTENMLQDEKCKLSYYFYSEKDREIISGTSCPVLYQEGDGTFEPFKQQLTTLQLPNPLRGIPVDSGGNYTDADGQQWICDYIDRERGKYVQCVQEIVFDGVSSGKKVTAADPAYYSNANYAYIETTGIKRYTAVISNKLKYLGSIENVDLECLFVTAVLSISLLNTRTGIVSTDSEQQRVDKINVVLKQWYDEGSPLIVYYQLANPIETDLTSDQIAALNLSTYQGITNIGTDTMPQVEMAVESRGFNLAGDLAQDVLDLQNTVQIQGTTVSNLNSFINRPGRIANGVPIVNESNTCLMYKAIADIVYPVGSIYLSVNNINPGTFFGGTWVAWGSGQVPVGVNTSVSQFATVEQTGGEITHTLTTAEMPSHDHSISGGACTTGSGGSHNHTYGVTVHPAVGFTLGSNGYSIVTGDNQNTSSNGNHSHSVPDHAHDIGNTGGGQAHNNLQPYITCYMWKRTA